MTQLIVKQSVKDSILDAANALLGEHGYRKMTVSDISARAGIGKGSVYLHFISKEEVALSTIDRMVEGLLLELEQLGRAPRPARERLRDALILRVSYRLDHRPHPWQCMDELLSDCRRAFLERRARYNRKEAAILATILRDGLACGEFSHPSPDAAAASLVLATNSLLPQSLRPEELGSRDQVLRQATALADLLVSGVLSRASI